MIQMRTGFFNARIPSVEMGFIPGQTIDTMALNRSKVFSIPRVVVVGGWQSVCTRRVQRVCNPHSVARLGCRGQVAIICNVGRKRIIVSAGDNEQGAEMEPSADQRLDDLEARLGVGRKSRREGGGAIEAPPPPKPKAKPKKWDDMSLQEQAWELYIGEKGALFWLNKLAYASIYLIIGGWIVFRFIGPALGWYELDSPLLPPSQVLAGSTGR